MSEWVSIQGQMVLPPACRAEAEKLVKEMHPEFEHLDINFQDLPDSFIFRIEAYGRVQYPGAFQSAICRLGREAKRLAQFRIISSDRNDYLFLGNSSQVDLSEQLAYKLDAVTNILYELSPQQQRVLSASLDEILFPAARNGTDGG